MKFFEATTGIVMGIVAGKDGFDGFDFLDIQRRSSRILLLDLGVLWRFVVVLWFLLAVRAGRFGFGKVKVIVRCNRVHRLFGWSRFHVLWPIVARRLMC